MKKRGDTSWCLENPTARDTSFVSPAVVTPVCSCGKWKLRLTAGVGDPPTDTMPDWLAGGALDHTMHSRAAGLRATRHVQWLPPWLYYTSLPAAGGVPTGTAPLPATSCPLIVVRHVGHLTGTCRWYYMYVLVLIESTPASNNFPLQATF